MRALLHMLDDPHLAIPSLLVAGTKGKGSTVAMLAACLRAAGLSTGRYTSPHLINWRERTWLNGQPISTDAVLALGGPIREAVERLPAELGKPTTFEVGTAFASLHFARSNVDVAVWEVGVGGRHDATNVVEPLVSAITPISYDHTPTLGSTLSAIADQKAGVLRPGRPGILAPQPAEARLVIERIARGLGTELDEVGRDWRWTVADPSVDRARAEVRIESTHPDVAPLQVQVGLLGDHQRDNATTAVAALHGLSRARPDLVPSPQAIQAGLANVDWPGRLQVLREAPLLVLDGAHNAASAEVLGLALEQGFSFRRLLLVLGLSTGKDAQGMVDALGPRAAHVYLTRSRHERSADPAELARLSRERLPALPVTIGDDVGGAIDAALQAAEAEDLVVVTGSLFVVGEALVWWARSPR
jgi:dihydrofolate synthase/folylpolyglutamate synthase